jgi:hypothetical protein
VRSSLGNTRRPNHALTACTPATWACASLADARNPSNQTLCPGRRSRAGPEVN